MLNVVIVSGNLVRDPEFKTIQGSSHVRISIACNRVYMHNGTKKEEVDYFDCEFWGKQADTITTYKKKGDSVLVEGRLKQQRWKDDSGKSHSKVGIVGTRIQFLSSWKRKNDGTDENQPNLFNQEGEATVGNNSGFGYDESQAGDEDIPF